MLGDSRCSWTKKSGNGSFISVQTGRTATEIKEIRRAEAIRYRLIVGRWAEVC
ncbi:hypothetical protein [Robertmurraya sp. DFI.2.37]|uniref:hypothetical protein n=1 Tax=Robertmurraya sp. DFI.2.37 TaxID=3031819 RepID=UPI00177BE74C|nr:hypothetical protein [Robertmurraya sp. DFI.2.37]